MVVDNGPSDSQTPMFRTIIAHLLLGLLRWLRIGRRPAKGHGSLTEQVMGWADVMGFDRLPTHIIEKRGTELDGAIQSAIGREVLGHLGNSTAIACGC
jgi:hypothetical protein